MEYVTKQSVIDRLRPIFEEAARERTGVSYYLTGAERILFTDKDLEQLKEETGYTEMLRSSNRPSQL